MINRPYNEIIRLVRAFGYSIEGLAAAWRQAAFRLEIILGCLMITLSLFLGRTPAEHALLVASIFLVWMVELLNSAVEAAIDRIGPEMHLLSKRAKDIGSAAVLVSIACAGAVWLIILAGK